MLLCIAFFALCGVVIGGKAMDPGPLRIAVIRLEPAEASIVYWILTVGCGLFVLSGIAAIVQRIVAPKTLELGIDALSLPSGFMQRGLVQIPYRDIQSISDVSVSGEKFLYIHTAPAGRRYTLTASLLPSKAAFEEVREFLISVTTPV